MTREIRIKRSVLALIFVSNFILTTICLAIIAFTIFRKIDELPIVLAIIIWFLFPSAVFLVSSSRSLFSHRPIIILTENKIRFPLCNLELPRQEIESIRRIPKGILSDGTGLIAKKSPQCKNTLILNVCFPFLVSTRTMIVMSLKTIDGDLEPTISALEVWNYREK